MVSLPVSVAARKPDPRFEGEPTLETIERDYLARLLEKYHGNRRRVAEALGVSERTAYRMLERHGFKDADPAPSQPGAAA